MKESLGERGFLARVVHGGTIYPQDRVEAYAGVHSAFAADWRERVLAVATSKPENVEFSFAEIAMLAGVHVSFCRVFPRLFRERGVQMISASAKESSARSQLTGVGYFYLDGSRIAKGLSPEDS